MEVLELTRLQQLTARLTSENQTLHREKQEAVSRLTRTEVLLESCFVFVNAEVKYVEC